jgi:large subunit ribosomal protein L29
VAVIRKKEIRSLSKSELDEKLGQLKAELSRERAAIASSTRAENPGRVRELRRTIARILTITHEKETQKQGVKTKG